MSINLTDEIEVKTKKGKLGAAKQIFLEGDIQTVEKEIQDINSRHNALNTKHESLSRTVQGIAATGGASTATNVTYNNDVSRLNAENAQDAIDELQSSKIGKTSILQESGDAEDKVMSQKAVNVELDKKVSSKTDNSSADLNIGDNKGNVILRLENGHIKTKNFDSEKNNAELNKKLITKTDNSSANFNIGDDKGNVILRLKNGHIKTKNFDSKKNNTELDKKFDKTSVVQEPGDSEELVMSQKAVNAELDKKVSTETYGSSVSFSIGDPNGNVIAQFKNGHIKTKNFDSEKLIPTTGYNYIGQKIDIVEYQYNKSLLFTESTSSKSSIQGAACFGKYLFQFHNTNDCISIFNLDTKERIYEIKQEPNSNYHCNNVNFGNEYYDSKDEFPLLYLSIENSEEHKCLVYRIKHSEEIFEIELVQTIILPTPSNDFLWYPNVMIEQTRSKLIIGGLGNNSWSHGVDNELRYEIYALPKLAEGDITLDRQNKEDSFILKNHPTTQGGFIKNNKIYQVFGGINNARLNVIDIFSHHILSQIELWNTGLNLEPEACFAYDNTICINFIDGKIYKLKF